MNAAWRSEPLPGCCRLSWAFVCLSVIVACSVPLGLAAQPRQSTKPANAAVEPDKKEQTEDGTAASAATKSVVSTAPSVTYKDGLLTVVAENAPLSAIMAALHAAMGTDVDLPAGASNQPIWVHIGPGPARNVLDELLSATDLNFIIQGSVNDDGGIRSVLLTEREEPGAKKTRVPAQAPEQATAASQQPEKEVAAADSASAGDASVPVAAAVTEPPLASGTPKEVPPSDAPMRAAVDGSVAHPAPPASMTQDEISQQLLSMYAQRRQLQQPQQTSTASH